MSRVESGPHTGVRTLFIATAALELGAGLTLLAMPAVVIRLLFGSAVGVFPASSTPKRGSTMWGSDRTGSDDLPAGTTASTGNANGAHWPLSFGFRF